MLPEVLYRVKFDAVNDLLSHSLWGQHLPILSSPWDDPQNLKRPQNHPQVPVKPSLVHYIMHADCRVFGPTRCLCLHIVYLDIYVCFYTYVYHSCFEILAY